MPGILPMKVIKVGNSAQSRIAQACDRCRSKKIRCDGTRPTCSQCANVGFECRTSDKLSRRAFPRGYTESLEERVRVLELEVRELKDLLDEKDEKIDMLSRMHGNRRKPSIASPPLSTGSPESSKKEPSPPREDTFRVQASPLLLDAENSDSYFMGPSSGRAFVEAFKRKIQETGKPCSDFNPEAFLHIQGTSPLTSSAPEHTSGAPPRLFSDRCVNVYFQEWAPLFPVLHKPTFLRTYEDFVSDPSKIKSHFKTAQLYLVFSIAGLSQDSPDLPQLAECEEQWTKSLDSLAMDNTMNTLQCLILALLYYSMRADYKKIQHYKGIAVGLSHRLGLHQSQKRFSFGALTTETRKKVFWTLYTLDCFTAATLGLPKLLKEEDVQAEYPSDTDDEYVTEKGFQPTLPGESTRLSSALALFRATRILARVLERNYPAAPTHELSLQQMESLESDLDAWYTELPSHLRLNFVQDKPSTDVTGSRSPLLALAYYFIRTLIYRPAVGSSLGQKAAPALLSIGDSSKHIIQIMELLEERRMIFSFCLNKHDVLILCGMTLLYQVLDFKQDSKLVRDNGRLVNTVIKIAEDAKAPGYWSFKSIAGRIVTVDDASNSSPVSTTSSTHSNPGHNQAPAQSFYQMGATPEAAASESDLTQQQERLRRLTMPAGEPHRPQLYRSPSRHSLETTPSDAAARPHRLSVSQTPKLRRQESTSSYQHPNLDYLSLSNTPTHAGQLSPPQPRQMAPLSDSCAERTPLPLPLAQLGRGKGSSAVSSADWEMLLGTMDGGMNNVYDAIYGGSSFLNEAPVETGAPCPTGHDWSPDSWELANLGMGNDFVNINPAAPQSVLSLSDESLSSGEDGATSEMGLSMGSVDYQTGTMMPACGNGDGFIFDGLDKFPL